MKLHYRLSALALGVFLLGSGQAVFAQHRDRVVSFGALEAAKPEAARALVLSWLKESGKADPAIVAKVEAVWKQNDQTVLDRMSECLTLGSPQAARLLADARNTLVPPPIKVPDIFKDAKQPLFFRANLGLLYARALSNRQVYEEGLEVLRLFQPEQVVSPTSYLFHRAVCEHALLLKSDATRTIARILEDAITSPDRYKTVSALMLLDMQTWKDKDLGAVARKMKISERRLDLARGGPETQKIQKEIEARLRELIKELENKAKGSCNCNGGGCPNGSQPGQGGGANPTNPMQDSQIANNSGTGRVDAAKMRKLMDGWGKMQPREQARAVQELTRGLDPRHRESIENYFRNLAQLQRR